ncbi:MAG: tetratricopeptide repeat protein [Porcipelethomonas sp.]
MKYKIIFSIDILVVILSAGICVYELFLNDNRNIRTLSKAIVVFVTFALALLRIRPKRSPFDSKIYMDKYGDIIGNAFKNDRKSHKLLINAIEDFNYNKYDRAIKALDKLYESSCTESCEYSAVLMFKALCSEGKGMKSAAKEAYEELLRYDVSNSKAWSNLGLIYNSEGNSSEAENAYRNAVSYDPNNAYAYNNLAVLYFNSGQTEKALEYALKAIELRSDLYQAMGTASLSYKKLGDYTNSAKYFEMYMYSGAGKANVEALSQMLKKE